MPRVVSLAVAAGFLLFLVPLATHLPGRSLSVQVVLVVVALPLALVTFACLVAAARPGALGRMARKARSRRT